MIRIPPQSIDCSAARKASRAAHTFLIAQLTPAGLRQSPAALLPRTLRDAKIKGRSPRMMEVSSLSNRVLTCHAASVQWSLLHARFSNRRPPAVNPLCAHHATLQARARPTRATAISTGQHYSRQEHTCSRGELAFPAADRARTPKMFLRL